MNIPCPHCGKEITLVGSDPDIRRHSLSDALAWVHRAYLGARRHISPQRFALFVVLLVLAATFAAMGLRFVARPGDEGQRHSTDELARPKADADVVKIEQDEAATGAEVPKPSSEPEAKAHLQGKTAPAGEAHAAAEAPTHEEERTRLEQERKARLTNNPALWALWEEPDRNAVRIVATRPMDATVSHKGALIVARYEDMPHWLRQAALAKHKEDGEAKGLIREVDGKIYDLRAAPPGWVTLPTAEVIQIIEDGYLMIDVASLQKNLLPRVFKLKHNGLTRILNTGDRVRLTAMSVGTYTYVNKKNEIRIVPVYDPGMPVGPLRARVVTMSGRPPRASARTRTVSEEPIASASGFFISEEGLFITSAHVVEEATRIQVKTVAGKKHATVLRVDNDKDLALLRVELVKGTVPALNVATNPISLGAQVFTIGYPMVELQGSRPKYTDGNISGLAGLLDDPDQMQISVPVQPGNSGGPLVDMNGDVVGVVASRLNDLKIIAIAGTIPQNVNYAIKGTTLIRFLSENKMLASGVRLGRSSPRTREEAIRLVEEATGLVLVYD
ncbi:MAG: serine protease [Limisphaera sp.]|nr:serine protease [Limisphaera sp.]